MRHRPQLFIKPPRYQAGIVLIASLIMLSLLMIIGVNAMQTSGLEEKMAGNMRDRNIAFQAAESALTAGENYLSSVAAVDLPPFNCANGLFPKSGSGGCATAALNPLWDKITWTNADSRPYVGNLENIKSSANPRYIIELMPCNDANIDGDCNDVGDARRYRVTARATGATIDAVVMVQSIFEIPN